jgi:hypothetical protein
MSKGKTLVSGIRASNERKVNDLRTYEAPPEVQVFDCNHNLIRTEAPTLWEDVPKFNGRRK